MNNELGRKITSLTLMTIMVAGGLTFAVPGVMPEAMAANANLFVSAENSQFNNLISGPQVIEVVVIDSNINTLDDDLGEPDVTVNGKKLRMAQATDGNWYAYFAEVEQAQLADYTAVVTGGAGGLDFGTFCDPTNAGGAMGFSVSETKGIAFNNNEGRNGTATAIGTTSIAASQSCTSIDGNTTNGTINVVREYKDLNIQATNVGQIGFNVTLYPKTNANAVIQFGTGAQVHNTNAVWPFIQLYDFTTGGTVDVTYNRGGGAQTASFTFDTADGNAVTTLDRSFYPKDADVHFEIADSWLNIDPTDEDSWTFDTNPDAAKTYYGYYDEDGTAVKPLTADITSNLSALMQGDASLKIDQDASGTDIIDLSGNDNGAVLSSTKITILESGVNTGIFTSYDSDDESAVEITAGAARGNSATITYDDSDQSIVVRSSFGTLDIAIDDDEWNSGETASVTLIDEDLNKNSRSDEDLDVSSGATLVIPTLETGNPFTIGEGFTSSQFGTSRSGNVYYLDAAVSDIAADTLATYTPNTATNNTNGALTVAKYSKVGNFVPGSTDADIKTIIVPMNGTVSDLRNSINTNSTTTFYGTNLFAWDVASLSSSSTYNFYLLNYTDSDSNTSGWLPSAALAKSLLELKDGGSASGTATLSQTFMDVVDSYDSADELAIVITVDDALVDLTASASYPITLDFMTWGFSNDGDDAAERTSNQIIRFELEESGDSTGIFEGTLEYVMINQLNVQQAATFTGLTLTSDGPTFIAFEDLTDEDSPRVNYLDLGQDGVETQIADQLAAPSHSGIVYFDNESYKVADTVTITLEDADLNTDVDLINIFTVVDGTSDADRDQVGIDTNLSDFSFGSLGRLLDVTFDDARWQYDADCSSLDGLSGTGFTLVETGVDTGVFTGDFQIPDNYCNGTSSVSTTGVDIEVNYLDYRDASGEIIEVGDAAAVRANTGSITLDRTVYPVPFGVDADFTLSSDSSLPNGRSIFPIHQTGMAATTGLETGEYIANGDLTIHVRVNDPDFDVSATGEDQIATGSSGSGAPVKISVIRGSSTVILGYAGTTSEAKGVIDTDGSDLTAVRSFGPMDEIAPDAGIFEADIVIRYTDGPRSTLCPDTTTYTNIKDASGTAQDDRFDTTVTTGGDFCILQGDILQVEYTDPTDASGDSNTVTDSATFDLRNGVLQSDKSVYIIGSDIILTLIEPDFDLDNDAAETYDLDLIEWDSDARTVTIGGENESTAALEASTGAAFDPEPSAFRETGDSTGIFQVVLEMPAALQGTNLERGEQIDLEYTDWGPSGADYVGSDDEDVNVTIYTSNFGATVELDQKVYTWTDKVYITIVAPDHNMDSALIDEIGNTASDHIKISTRGFDIDRYKLVETGVDTGIFTGEVILTGFDFNADGDLATGNVGGVAGNDVGGTATSADGVGPTNGFLETSDDDGLTVSFEYSEDETVVGSALIRWNIGEIQWLEASYPASGTGVVRVIDPDMNWDPEAVDNYNIDVWSDSDAGGIDLTVTETNEATGIFEGTVFFTVSNESSGHRLRVSEGDTVTAEYEDNTLPEPYTTADEINVTATTLIGTVVPPLERAPAANLRTVDAFGNSLDTVSVDQQVQISADLSNGQDREQAFAYLVQIQDENGVTVSLAWITGSLSSGQSFSPALSWIPSEAGTYTATAFVWESVDNPTALSPPVSTTVNVR
jgi:hypothetical protein